LINLAVNARDAMPEGGALTVVTRNERESPTDGAHGSEGEEFLLMEISDTGTGMTEEVKAHIFEPYFTTKRPEQGTGLGLDTVFRIVREAHGRIAVSTELGRGTTFRLYLPVRQPAGQESR
jgi:two-component system, cell cycle sensor histidine kinase and response regulator CckA